MRSDGRFGLFRAFGDEKSRTKRFIDLMSRRLRWSSQYDGSIISEWNKAVSQ